MIPEKLYDSKNLIIKYYHSYDLIEVIWESFEFIIDFEILQKELYQYLSFVKKYQPNKSLWHLEKLQITIDLEMQEWIDSSITSKEKNFIKKQAYIIPLEYFSNLSIELLNDEGHNTQIESKMFEDREQAFNWLLNI